MKKLLTISLLTLMLVGCSKTTTTKLTSGDELLWAGPNESYTKADLYKEMKNQNDYSSLISNSVLKTIAEVDGLDIDALVSGLDEQYESYVEFLGEYAYSYFGDKENFIRTLLPDAIASKYMEEDIKNNFDSYVSNNNPYYGEVFYVTDEAQADAINEAVTTGKNTLEYAATEAGYTQTIAPGVYTDKSDLPIEVKEVILNNEAPFIKMVKVETFQTSDGNSTSTIRYYFVSVTSKDATTFKDEFISHLTSDIDKTSFIQELIEKHDIRFYDQDSYDAFSSVYEGAK